MRFDSMDFNHPIENRASRREMIILILCLFMGFALRFYTFEQKSLWLDEIYTLNEAKYGLKEQIKFYEEKPYHLHPPLFFALTHFLFPFTKPERDLRILPMIFGILSIPMIYFLSRLFSRRIALPCTFSLTFMAYHISLSQEGRSYSMLMFFGMVGLYFFIKHLQTMPRMYLLPVALSFAILFHASYSSIPFIVFSQLLWFYRTDQRDKKYLFSSFLIMNGLLLLMCLPWIVFLLYNYSGQPILGQPPRPDLGSFWNVFSGILNDWVPYAPLTIVSMIFLVLFLIFSKFDKNVLVLLALFLMPIGGLYLYCALYNISHFITSRYFINFLPLFLITLYLSTNAVEDKFGKLGQFVRLQFLFVILFIASNLVILPLYYRAEKEDFRGLVNYLKGELRQGDKLLDIEMAYTPGILFYFGVYPEGRHYSIPFYKISENKIEFRKSFIHQNRKFTIYYSSNCCAQYVADGSRLWIIGRNRTAKKIDKNSPCVLKGYFDGSSLNFDRFPTDASIYLFLWDPKSVGKKGIDMPIK